MIDRDHPLLQSAEDYVDVFITTIGEVPGLLGTIALMALWGRRWVLSLFSF